MDLDMEKMLTSTSFNFFIWGPISLGFEYITFGFLYGLSTIHFGPL